MSKFPSQFRAGCVEFPDLVPFPQVYNVEMFQPNGQPYQTGTTAVVRCRGQVTTDIACPTYVWAVSFDLVRVAQDPLANPILPINTYLPLSSQSQSFVPASGAPLTVAYTGNDFRWRIRTSSDGLMWQSGFEWRSSAQCQNTSPWGGGQGYIFPAEYRMNRNDTIQVEVEPLAAPPSTEDEFQLIANVHLYKMVTRSGETYGDF
tara:strand:+ start:1080 stop:1691 length:612 start_codon:yes stop_codon:yes gene_type:complete